MKVYIQIIVSMTLTGTIPFLGYLFLKKVLAEKTSVCFRYRVVKGLLLCYLIPFSLIYALISHIVEPKAVTKINDYTYFNDTIRLSDDGLTIHITDGFQKNSLIVFGIILFVLVGFIFYRYFRLRFDTRDRLIFDELHLPELEKQMEFMGVRRKMTLFYCDASISPFTYGIQHPCIVLTSAVPEEAVSIALRHELQHIKSHDFLIRGIAGLAVLLHCFNPFIYFLWREVNELQEMACDEKISLKLSAAEKKNYAHLLIDIAACNENSNCSLYLSKDGKKVLHNRITSLDTVGKKKSPLLCAFFAAVCLVCFCIPVVACPPQIMDIQEQDLEFDGTEWIFLEDGPAEIVVPIDENYFKFTDEYFILEDGNIIIGSYIINNSSLQVSCSHTWINGKIKSHKLDGKGGCNVITYQAEYCTKCNSIKNKTEITNFHYNSCPHN